MNTSSILIVDDDPNNFDVIEALLSPQSYQLHYCSNGYEAIERLDKLQPDLILLDVMMPGIDGIEVCRQIKAIPAWDAVPIIMVTALTSKSDLADCLASGADDFISKPLNHLELTARVRSMLRIRDQYQQLATFNTKLEETVQQRTAKLRSLIFEDSLTELPSKIGLLHGLANHLQREKTPFALLYLNCNQFKLVNSSFGYDIGDQLLLAITQRLKQFLRPDDMLSRVGEDEFCFFLSHTEDMKMARPFIAALQKSFERPFAVTHSDIFMSISIGVSLSQSPNASTTSGLHEKLLRNARIAMYQTKLQGQGNYQLYDQSMHSAIVNRLTLENDLRRAIDNQEFVVYYQPIFHLKTQKISGFEALVRWQHPTRGLVSPAEFIPSMEISGLIVPLGMRVLQQACKQLQSWQHKGWHNLTMSVNLSVRQFTCPTLLEEIDDLLSETNIDPTQLRLEITESAIMENAESAIALIKAFRKRHIQLSIDDFGTGYSSLGYLHQFPVNNLKIDRSFVQDLCQSSDNNYRVVDTIITLSHQLGLSVVAEGIETTQQLEQLQQLGCEFGQGYLFSKPLPAESIEHKYYSGSSSTATYLVTQSA